MLRALTDSKQKIPTPLADLSAKFLKKVEAGEARKAGNGFSGKGFSFESSEKSEKQQLQMIERRQALIEVGATVEDEVSERAGHNSCFALNNQQYASLHSPPPAQGTNKLLDDMINKKNAAEVKELLKKERDAQRAIEKAKEKTKAVVDVVPGGGVVVNGQVINLPGLGYPVAGAAAAGESRLSRSPLKATATHIAFTNKQTHSIQIRFALQSRPSAASPTPTTATCLRMARFEILPSSQHKTGKPTGPWT